jgi:DNA-binding winged helix-turn-helix (wHTH) protein
MGVQNGDRPVRNRPAPARVTEAAARPWLQRQRAIVFADEERRALLAQASVSALSEESVVPDVSLGFGEHTEKQQREHERKVRRACLAKTAENLRKTLNFDAMPVRFGAFSFDAQRRELRRGDALLPLSPKAFRLLELLIEARPNPVSHGALYDALWPDVVVEAGNLHTLISELRSTLGDRSTIRTVHRVGYAFVAEGAGDVTPRYAVIAGDDEFPLREGANGIGRDPRDAVALSSSSVSRHHARITVQGTRVTIEDLGSKNGTFVQSRRITTPVELAAGDAIVVGTILLRLIAVDALAPTATAG